MRTTEIDKVDMHLSFRPGDIIRAEVVSSINIMSGPWTYDLILLSTLWKHLDVLSEFCVSYGIKLVVFICLRHICLLCLSTLA